MPANARAILIEALREAHRWLDELLSDTLGSHVGLRGLPGGAEGIRTADLLGCKHPRFTAQPRSAVRLSNAPLDQP